MSSSSCIFSSLSHFSHATHFFFTHLFVLVHDNYPQWTTMWKTIILWEQFLWSHPDYFFVDVLARSLVCFFFVKISDFSHANEDFFIPWNIWLDRTLNIFLKVPDSVHHLMTLPKITLILSCLAHLPLEHKKNLLIDEWCRKRSTKGQKKSLN